MFGAFGKKVITSVVTFTSMLFSSYKGNFAEFDGVALQQDKTGIEISANLENAFENDFEEFFRCGKPITVWFLIQVRYNRYNVAEMYYAHRVKYDPLLHFYTVFIQENDQLITLDSHEQVLEAIRGFHCKWEVPPQYNPGDEFEVVVSGYLTKLRLESTDEEFDLMNLWHHKRPIARGKFVWGYPDEN